MKGSDMKKVEGRIFWKVMSRAREGGGEDGDLYILGKGGELVKESTDPWW